MYQKEIVYMNLYESNIKISCVGYLKQEKKHENYNIELQVKNVPDTFAGSFAIRFQGTSGWKEPDSLTINGGSGKWMGSISEPVMRAEVLLTDSYRIKGESRNIQTAGADDNRRSGAKEEDNNNRRNVTDRENNISHGGAGVELKENRFPNNTYTTMNQNRTSDIEITKADMENKGQSSLTKMSKKDRKFENMPLYENKWEQLLAAYEQIHPYGDNRVYVKLAPKDFIILRSDYQHLVNNSFLLHGFYNYRYLILGKETGKEKDFYIGVPGVFYEREKMVALMFGFEAFECEGGDAEEGKFGYYLRKVEI